VWSELLHGGHGARSTIRDTLAAAHEQESEVLGSTKASKNDPNDALVTAVAGLRHCGLRRVSGGPPRRHSSGHRPRRQPHGAAHPSGVRLHATQRELVAGGAPRRLSADRAAKLLRTVHCDEIASSNATVSPSNSSPTSAASTVTSPRRECRVTDAVMASGTTLLEVHGVGSIVAGVHPRSRR
jgi:transposase